MNYYVLTVAFCPAAQLARSLLEYRKNRSLVPTKHIVIQGHYPINTVKNNRDIKMIVESYGEAELWDPGSNIGSAQSQNFALQLLNPPDDSFFTCWDPDSNCKSPGWDAAMYMVLNDDPDCVAISCRAGIIERVINYRHQIFRVKKAGNNTKYGILDLPTPFNLSMIRYSFIKEIGGMPQMGEMWGELEAPFFQAAFLRQKYHAYLMDHFEDESGKLMQDKQLLEFKDKNMRTSGPEQFPGIYIEYLRWKYPHLLETDTFIDDNTEFQ